MGILQGTGLKGIGVARLLKALAAAGVGKGDLVGNLIGLMEPTKLQKRLVSGGLNNAVEILSRLEEIGALKEERAADVIKSKEKREDRKINTLVEDAAYKSAMQILTSHEFQEFQDELNTCTNTADVKPLLSHYSREFYYAYSEHDIADSMDHSLHGWDFLPAVKRGLLKAAREINQKAEKLGKAKYKKLRDIQNYMEERGYRQTAENIR